MLRRPRARKQPENVAVEARAVKVHPLVVAVLQAAGVLGGFAVLVYAFYRAVLGAKKAGRTGAGELIAGLLMFLGTIVAPAPPREVATESREQKRDQDESGDPP